LLIGPFERLRATRLFEVGANSNQLLGGTIGLTERLPIRQHLLDARARDRR
jgi:hypothetical protein